MRRLFGLSLLLNLGLGGFVAYLMHSRTSVPSAVHQNHSTEAFVTRKPMEPWPLECTRQPFRWGEVESTNYVTYIANLRSIGCPEQTIRDIITADVGELYARKIEASLASPGSLSGQNEESELKEEEAYVLEVLLGPGPSDAVGAVVQRSPAQAPTTTMPVPLVLANVDLRSSTFPGWQVAAIQDLRRRFDQEVTASGFLPSDPGYAAVWQKAQAKSDDLLQATLGAEGFVDYELAVRAAGRR